MKTISGCVPKAAGTIEAELRVTILKVNLTRQQQMKVVLTRCLEVAILPRSVIHDVSFPALWIRQVLPEVVWNFLEFEWLRQFLRVAFSHDDDLK